MSERRPWEPSAPYEGLQEDPAPQVSEYFKALIEREITIEDTQELPIVEMFDDGQD